MKKELADFINANFQVPISDGPDKRCTPEQAIDRHIEKGMSLYLPCGAALLNPLIRAFWGQNPEFTIISTGVTQQLHAMMHGGLVKKAITSFTGHTYPSPRPCGIIQKAYLSGQLNIENWTIRTIIERLMAAATGLDFFPTHSLIGSSMAEDNKDYFKVIDEPFGTGKKIGLVKALHPDIAMMHAAAADVSGNAIFTYPLIGDVFGAWAAKKGVIISTEKIVSTDYIRKNAHMVRIPSQLVLGVCEAPFGLHPYGVFQHGLTDYEQANFPDYEFQNQITEASKNGDDFNAWIKEWILDCNDHDEYLAKLGTRKLFYLRSKSQSDAWKYETDSECRDTDFEAPPNSLEKIVSAAAGVIADKCIKYDYDSLLSGIGLANLSAWLGRHLLEEKGYKVDLLAEVGMSGYYPRPSDPTAFSPHNMHTCKFLGNIESILGLMVSNPRGRTMGILGAGQIDIHGNANSTLIPNTAYLVGSGGANDVAATSRESIVIMNAGKTRLVPEVPYITFPGTNIKTLVTDLGVFEKLGGEDFFTLTSYIPSDASQSEDECIEAVKENAGWELKVSSGLKRIEPPDRDELTLMRLFDPHGFFIGTNK